MKENIRRVGLCLVGKSIRGTGGTALREETSRADIFRRRGKKLFGREGERNGERRGEDTAGWTNSIVVGRLTAIGQRDIFSYQV